MALLLPRMVTLPAILPVPWQPIVWLGIYLFLTAFVVYRGVNKGIENYSKILMPILLILIIGISVFSLTLTHTDATVSSVRDCRV